MGVTLFYDKTTRCVSIDGGVKSSWTKMILDLSSLYSIPCINLNDHKAYICTQIDPLSYSSGIVEIECLMVISFTKFLTKNLKDCSFFKEQRFGLTKLYNKTS